MNTKVKVLLWIVFVIFCCGAYWEQRQERHLLEERLSSMEQRIDDVFSAQYSHRLERLESRMASWDSTVINNGSTRELSSGELLYLMGSAEPAVRRAAAKEIGRKYGSQAEGGGR